MMNPKELLVEEDYLKNTIDEIQTQINDLKEGLDVLNHSCAHMLAQAMNRLYPGTLFGVGPAIEEGFYYDIDLGDEVIKEEDLAKLEKEMKKISKDGKRIVRRELSKEEALEMFHLKIFQTVSELLEVRLVKVGARLVRYVE